MEDIFVYLDSLQFKDLSWSQHKGMQNLINQKQVEIRQNYVQAADSNYFRIYTNLLDDINQIQDCRDSVRMLNDQLDKKKQFLEECKLSYLKNRGNR